jgi:hypothetical protein
VGRQIRLKAEKEAQDRAEEERLIAMMRKKFADDERKEREEAARRKREKERVSACTAPHSSALACMTVRVYLLDFLVPPSHAC